MITASITMDGLTTSDEPVRFARPIRTRTVGVVSDDEDAQLMLAYARGEMRAFETLYSRHRGALLRRVLMHPAGRQRPVRDDNPQNKQ